MHELEFYNMKKIKRIEYWNKERNHSQVFNQLTGQTALFILCFYLLIFAILFNIYKYFFIPADKNDHPSWLMKESLANISTFFSPRSVYPTH